MDIEAKVVKYNNYNGEELKTKKTEMRLCHGETPMIFEILVKEGTERNTVVWVDYNDVRNFVLAREGK